MVLFILGLIHQKIIQLDGKSKELAKIEWSKVQKKIPIHKFFIDSKTFHGDLFLMYIPQQYLMTGRW